MFEATNENHEKYTYPLNFPENLEHFNPQYLSHVRNTPQEFEHSSRQLITSFQLTLQRTKSTHYNTLPRQNRKTTHLWTIMRTPVTMQT